MIGRIAVLGEYSIPGRAPLLDLPGVLDCTSSCLYKVLEMREPSPAPIDWRNPSMIRRIQPGKRLSAAVVHKDIVYISGQMPDTLGADVATQTREILAKIERLLAEAGSNKARLLSANIWLADIATFDEVNSVWEAWLAPGEAPSRATVEARIANPGYRVEIAATAAV